VEHWPIQAHQSFKSHSIEQSGPSRGARVRENGYCMGHLGLTALLRPCQGHLIWGVTGKKHRWGSRPWIIPFCDLL